MPDPLGKELEGVTPPSPVEPDEPITEPEAEPRPLEDDRPDENVRGEFTRKLKEAEERSDAKLDAILGRVETIQTDLAGRNDAPPSKPVGAPDSNPLDPYSVDQLQAALVNDQIDDATKRSINAYLPVRVAREEARRIGEENRQTDAASRTRREANQAATDRFPELLDPTTPMHKKVNQILLARGSQTHNPTSVLDAANEAAHILGIGVKRQPRIPNKPGGVDGGSPVKSGPDGEYEGMTDAEIDAIEPKLAHLLGRNKDGTQKKFDRPFLKERSKMYKGRY